MVTKITLLYLPVYLFVVVESEKVCSNSVCVPDNYNELDADRLDQIFDNFTQSFHPGTIFKRTNPLKLRLVCS